MLIVAMVTRDIYKAVTVGLVLGSLTGLATGLLTPSMIMGVNEGTPTGFLFDGVNSMLGTVALVISVCVPACNVAAVWPLARHGGHGYWRELSRNPLIIATGTGLLGNLLGLQLPDLLNTTLSRIGAAALPLGLMSVGAGLQLGALREGPRLASALMCIRHLLLPAVALGLVMWLPLAPVQQAVLVAFAAMPTASSAYVLAVRMGGHAGFTAGLVTVSTLIGMFALPLWLTLLRTVVQA